MSENGNFKKSLFGFRKKQVLQYVLELSNEHKAETDALNEEIAKLNCEIEALGNEIENKNTELETIAAEKNDLGDLLSQSGEECKVYREKCDMLQRRVQYYIDRQDSVEREIQLARKKAEEINLDARARADKIIADSKDYTRMVEANVELIKKDAEEIRSEIRVSLEKLESTLRKIDELGEKKETETVIPVYSKKPVRSSKSILEEIKNIWRNL